MLDKSYFKALLTCLLVLSILKSNYGHSVGEHNSSTEFLLYQQKDSTLYRLQKKADSLYQLDKQTQALEIALKVLDNAPMEDLELIASTNLLIGKIWYETRTFDKAINYYKSSLNVYSTIFESSDSLVDGNSNLSRVDRFKVLDNQFKIGVSYQQLFEIWYGNEDPKPKNIYRDSTFYYFNKIIETNPNTKQEAQLKSKALYNISNVYLRDSLFNLAESYAMRSIEIDKQYGDPLAIVEGYVALSNIQFFKEDYQKSKIYLKEGEEILDKITGEKADEIKAALYFNMAYSMYMLKDYKAYEYQERSWEMYDEIKDRDTQKKIADIYASRNFNRGFEEGILLEEIKRRTTQRNMAILGVSSLFVIVLLVFLVSHYRLRQKNLGLELSQQDLLQQQKLEKIKADSQTRILNATLDGKESERKQIAETLHDSVSALLSSANLHLQACKTQFNGSTPEEIFKSQNIINEASQKIRDLSHTLVSSILLKFGLGFAIKDMAEKFSNSELTIDYETHSIHRYDQDFEIKLYNIIQEFVNNILKHSKATVAKIILVEKRKKLYLTIEDNGKGFDRSKISQKDGLGINQIDARIQVLNGKFTIDSGAGKGTTIKIELPVVEKKVELIS